MGADPFAKARAMKALKAVAKPEASAPGSGPAPKANAKPEPFPKLAKRFGLDHSKLDESPSVARVQLHQHLAQHLGKDYMKHPAVHSLIASFNDHQAGQEPKAPSTLADMA